MASVLTTLPVASAVADCLAMPAGSRQYIQVSGNFATAAFCPNPPPMDCGDGASGTSTLNAGPSQNLVLPCNVEREPGVFVFAQSNNTANSMSLRHTTSSSAGVFHYNSMVDAFTIAGPPGSEGTVVPFTVRCRMIGRLSVGPRNFDGLHIGGGSAQIEIGTFSTSTDAAFNEQFRVTDLGSSLFESLAFANYGATRPTQSFDRTRTLTLMRTVGQPFDLAFGFNCTGSVCLEITGADGGGVATMTIDFDLPEGFSVSSERGWTDPDAPLACPADLAAEIGVLDINDILTFAQLFNAQDSAADFAAAFGVFDINDILVFAQAFNAGCP